MKEFNEIDQLFRSSLADYKPVPEAKSKERFLASATGLWAGSSGSGLKWKHLLLAAVLLLSISGTFYYYLSPDNEQQTNLSPTQTTNSDVEELSAVTLETEGVDNKTEVIKASEETDQQNAENLIAQPEKNKASSQHEIKDQNPTVSPVNNNTISSGIATKQVNQASLQAVSYAEHNTHTTLPLPPIFRYGYRQIPDIHSKPGNLIYREIPLQPFPVTEPTDEDYKRVKRSSPLNIAYSVHYRPEFVFNIIDNNKMVHTFGLDVHFKLFDDKYIIRTGVSSSVSKGYYEYAVIYNEYLGSYEGLDSITFQWDENHYHLVPTYHTSEREVFDTAVQTDVTKVNKRFTYLQIPLMLGYNFITHKSFSMGARLGPTLSILLSDRTLSDIYDPGKHRVIQVNQITPDRIETNWMLSAGVSFGFYSKKRLFYEIEPQFSYYFNSVYQKYDVTKPPFSIGIRLSIGIK